MFEVQHRNTLFTSLIVLPQFDSAALSGRVHAAALGARLRALSPQVLCPSLQGSPGSSRTGFALLLQVDRQGSEGVFCLPFLPALLGSGGSHLYHV